MDVVTLGAAKADAKRKYVPAADSLRLRALADLAASERSKSLANSRVMWEDSAAFNERWANFSNWTLGAASNLQISGGYVYANGAGANAGANHAWALGTTGVGRAVFVINKAAGATNSGGIIVGVTSGTAGAAPSTGGGNARGLYFRPSSVAQIVDSGTFTDLSGGLSSGLHEVVIVADAAFLSITVRRLDGTIEYRQRWARAGFSIQNLYIFNSDANLLTGSSIGPISTRDSTASASAGFRAGVEDVQSTAQWTAVGTTNIRVALPAGYDSRRPLPVVMAFHGNGSNALHFADHPAGQGVANAFLTAGYAVVSADNSGNVSTWGAQAGLDAYYTAYKYMRDNYPLGPVVFYGNSMGGLESLLSLAERRIPGVVAWVGTVPVCNLAANYVGTGNAQLFTSTIATAYGIAGDGSDYATKTLGHDAILKDGQAFRGLPMWVLVSTDDTSVIPADNWNLMEPKIQPYAAEYVRVNTTGTGGHSTTAIASNASAMVTFANKYISA
jgi:hypothetical protein